MNAEQSLAEFLDGKWTQRVTRAAIMVLGFFVPIGGMAIAYMVHDSRSKADVAQQAATEVLSAVGEVKESLGAVRGSIADLQSDLDAVKISAARTTGIVEQMQLQWRPTGTLPPLFQSPPARLPAVAEVP